MLALSACAAEQMRVQTLREDPASLKMLPRARLSSLLIHFAAHQRQSAPLSLRMKQSTGAPAALLLTLLLVGAGESSRAGTLI